MNIWKPVNKKTKKLPNEALPAESGATLPDVVASLSYSESGHASSSEGAMISYSSYYSETQETRGRRREPRSHHTVTPQGLGATPAGGYLPPQELGVVPAPPQGGSSRRPEACLAWTSQRTSSSEYNWNQQFQVSPFANTSSNVVTDGGNFGPPSTYSPGHGDGLEGARIRSMSSEPHGSSNGRNGDRRVRCSSATRNRPPRSRPSNVDPSTSPSSPPLHSVVPGNLSPPSTSPPVQRIEYQQSATVGAAVANTRQTCTLRSGNNPDFREDDRDILTENANQTDRSVPGGSYGYQVPDLEALLTQASSTRPANLPMVLASATRLHNMRRSQENNMSGTNQPPVRPILPLGIIVNAVFKTRDWLYVRTAHGAEGYVPYRVCLPLGILPPNRSSQNSTLAGCGSPWELRAVESSNNNRPVTTKSQTTFSTNTLGTQQRGRQRGRRRLNAENTNQTDLQKLQPSTSRIPPDNHGPRESLDPPSSSSHIV